ncbi:MAG: site-2 protease family protein, partial [Oscillospiraceae bacterium]|nr:site-2 protease family protein [Oscillospiraceae bacterium]
MLLRLFERGNTQQAIVWLLLALPVLLFSFSFHEAAHAFAANKMGDPTAKNLGRLTMNPAKHIDPVGFGAMLLVGIGWAKPVPVHTRYFKDPKKGMAFTAAAGPLSNVLLAFVGVIGYTIMQSVTGQIPFSYIALLEHPEAM